MAAPITVKAWMEFQSLLRRFLHYTGAKMCLFSKESNNDGLGHNQHIINGTNFAWLGTCSLKVGSVIRSEILHFFLLCQPL